MFISIVCSYICIQSVFISVVYACISILFNHFCFINSYYYSIIVYL